jgi:hypothetical protein
MAGKVEDAYGEFGIVSPINAIAVRPDYLAPVWRPVRIHHRFVYLWEQPLRFATLGRDEIGFRVAILGGLVGERDLGSIR